MTTPDDIAARRPLKSRATGWARAMSAWLARAGVAPNTISVFSVVFSAAAAALLLTVGIGGAPTPWLVLAAALIQARLLCNLMDGMVAIEGGRKTPVGDLYNEFPDRVADVIILAALGFCAASQPLGIHLGWLAAALAVMTACVRMHGASLTGGHHDFRGPMAKPQRMALATGACIAAAVLPSLLDWMFWALLLMVAGEAVTVTRRLLAIAATLGKDS